MKKYPWLIGIGIITGMLVIAIAIWTYTNANRPRLYIAVAGPQTGASAGKGQDMVNSVRLYTDAVNQSGGINGRRIELLIVDDANNATQAQAQAQSLVNGPALVVLGHRGSSTSLSAGAVYSQHHLPAITASSTAPSVTYQNDWYFRVIFDNNLQGRFIAHYIAQIMGHQTASIIYDEDEYGTTLAQAFKQACQEQGVAIQFERSFATAGASAETVADSLAAILAELQAVKSPGLILLSVHDAEGAALVAGIQEAGIRTRLFEPLITNTFITHYQELGHSLNDLDGLYTTASLIYDVAGARAQHFRHAYQLRYDVEPDTSAAAYFDAVALALKAIEDTGITGEDIAADRQKIRDYLAGITQLEDAFDGVTGRLYFDEHRNAVKPVPIGMYEGGRLVSAPIQLQPVTNFSRIPDLDAALRDKQIMLIDGIYMHKTTIAYTGVVINQISDLSLKDSIYTLDFHLWFRYQGDLDPTHIEFINAEDELQLEDPIATAEVDGNLYRAYRIKANFKGNFDFQDYPFDQQVLAVRFYNRDYTNEQLIYVRDDVGMSNDSHSSITFENAEGWSIDQALVYQDTLKQQPPLGNPQFFDTHPIFEYSRVNTEVAIQRDTFRYGVKNLFPMFIVILVTYLIFYIPASVLPTKITIGVNTLLTTAFFAVKVSSEMPQIGYLTSIEYFFFVVYALALFAIAVSILYYINEKEPWSKRLNMAGRIAYPLIILVVGIIFTFIYY